MQNQTPESPNRSLAKSAAHWFARLPAAISVIAVITGLILRWAKLSGRSLWFDEGYSAWAVAHPVGEVIRIIQADTAPPLYYVLLHGGTLVFGRSEGALRSMSALMASVALIVFVSIACKALDNRWARTAAIVLFSLSFMQTSFAHETRFYAMMTMLAVIDLFLVLKVVERVTPARLAALAIAWICSLYTNNMMAFYLACLGVAWLLWPGTRPFWGRVRDAAIVSAVSGLAFAFWLPSFLAQSRRIQNGFWPEVPDRWVLMRTIGFLTGVNEQSMPDGNIGRFVQIIIILLALIVLGGAARNRWQKCVGLVVFGLGPILMIFVYSNVRQSIFMERAFLPSGVGLPLLMVLVLESSRLRPTRIIGGSLVLVMIWMNIASLPQRWQTSQQEDWQSTCAYVDSGPARNRVIVFVSNECEIMYDYYSRNSDYSRRANLLGAPASYFAIDPPQTLRRVQSDQDLDELKRELNLRSFDEVVLVASHTWWGDHDHRTLALLSKLFEKTAEQEFPQITVFRFSQSGRRVSVN